MRQLGMAMPPMDWPAENRGEYQLSQIPTVLARKPLKLVLTSGTLESLVPR